MLADLMSQMSGILFNKKYFRICYYCFIVVVVVVVVYLPGSCSAKGMLMMHFVVCTQTNTDICITQHEQEKAIDIIRHIDSH